MKNTRHIVLITAAFVAMLALTIGRAADITPVEVRAIAEEGFIFGLPIVMNYAVMYEYAVDSGFGQFKAPFNQIYSEARVLPAPNDTIYLVMRLYWPKTEAPSILPPGDGT